VATALVSSIAPSTAKSYFSLFKKWKLWCTQFSEVNYFPDDDTYIALYLVNLLQSGFRFSTIQSAYYAIAFFIDLAVCLNPVIVVSLKQYRLRL